MKNRYLFVASCLGVVSVLTVLIAPFIGMQQISLSHILQPATQNIESRILWNIRIPRVVTAFLIGAGLALSGMVFQALFRNALATPFTLGISSGASVGAVIYIFSGISISLGFINGSIVFSFCGAFVSILFVFGLTKLKHGFSTGTMLLAGVACNFFFSSIILFIQYVTDVSDVFRIMRWLMGSLDIVGFKSFLTIAPFVLAGLCIVLRRSHDLNLITIGDDIAMSRGVEVTRVRNSLFFLVSLMIGAIVSVAGPIGFVGMMSPHICRLLIGPNHRHLTLATFLFGGTFLVICDTFARTCIAPAEIPVGVITSLLGGPFFIWLLVRGISEKKIV